MKSLIFIASLLLSASVCAQQEVRINDTFLRVYDTHGKKISNGKIVSFSEESLYLTTSKGPVEIPVDSIALIKTKHSAGHNVLIGAAAGTAIMAVASGSGGSGNQDGLQFSFSASEKAAGILIAGTLSGGIIGGITAIFKRTETYTINGDQQQWKAFMETMLR